LNPPKNLVALGHREDGSEIFAEHSFVYVRTQSGEWMRENYRREIVPFIDDNSRWLPTGCFDNEIRGLEKSYGEIRSAFCANWLQARYHEDILKLKEGLSAYYVGDLTPNIAKYLNVITTVPPCLPERDAYKLIAADVDLSDMRHVRTCTDGDEIWKIDSRDDISFEWNSQEDTWIKYDMSAGWHIDQCTLLYSILLSLRRKQNLPRTQSTLDDQMLAAYNVVNPLDNDEISVWFSGTHRP